MYRLAESPLLQRLNQARHILFAGAGGGFDVFSALPLFALLREQGKAVSLANSSFTSLSEVTGRRVTPHCVEVTTDSDGPARYFPEGYLTHFLAERGLQVPVYAFEKTGAVPLLTSYRALQTELAFDCVVLVDGGTDILMRGDEAGLGTPQEDVTSLAAVSQLDATDTLVCCLGFGIDRFHGVCHAHFLRNVAALSQRGGYLGTLALLPQMPEAQLLCDAIAFTNARMPAAQSIVGNSIASAIEGEYGDVHRTSRTTGSKLWINPLMSCYWNFDLKQVAERCMYLDAVKLSRSIWDVNVIVEAFRKDVDRVPWEDIPV
ncbi:MAG: DUF1152 domain-containing protein [Myxococcales bacterium]|nr:DUF1152 domain-containing protein [Myxococcales bacterium]